MSSETLSQHDIDQLLRRGGGGGGAPAAVTAAARPPLVSDDVQVYDFRRPNRVSKERLRTLEAMYERLVKALESWLIGRVRGQVELRLQSIEPFSFGEFTLSLPTPCASYLFSVRESGGLQGVVDVGYEFGYFVVDRLFGGSGEALMMQRSLTPIERQAVRGVAERVVALLEEIWADHVPLELELTGFETFPEILQAVNREDPVLVANIEVLLPGGASSLLLICLPFAVLDKFFGGTLQKRVSSSGSDEERDQARARTEASLRVATLPVSVRLPSFELSLRALSALQPGMVLDTGLARDTRAEVRVGPQRRFTASLGRVGSRLAAHIHDPVAPDVEPATAPSSPESLTPIF